MKAKKELGQNFLIDEHIVNILIQEGEVNNTDKVLDIGSGKGFVTKALSEKAGNVLGVELDKDLIPVLTSNLSQFKNVEIENGDILTFLEDKSNHKRFNKIVSSIPFQITSPLLHKIINIRSTIDICVLLIQKEVAERVTAKPPKANYLSIFLQTFFKVELITVVSKESFYPKSEVDGAIIKLTPLKKSLVKDDVKYSKFLHHGFTQQRKMLYKRFKKEVLEKAGIDTTRRAETLSVEEWVKIFKNSSLIWPMSS
ncbi:ribosomal RNA small subunit methyltransferase A [candidate division WWE3 bacterium RIFCSPHIGHO2_01_FULL_40_23]|uniref:Ribosomal RNA small subunit methyltransferase A n=1 Tax=candidate division WWE3 bacterium RIFCSPLOWO2_01_FULL_41_18 TaxID=1802625 RepID=A0A1F4VEY0_UNCKA|nr:MAG: ribosomal RNA small subunit methyltransferase A [candidate division WWE3 bacterium RIFCSPHIGHO2_01_FULL_40_23]OGC55253.1 MAG: ribosomal RNA small subunit methyltransferase A [candidate division WWE3 bacterium RIFCSPLOWO2_01_FULL_41_18]